MGHTFRRCAAIACVLTLTLAACTESDDSSSPDDTGNNGGDATEQTLEPSGLLEDNGPCDETLDPYQIGIMTVFESPTISLKDQVTAAEASVEAFNARGGIGGHCMELTACDSQLEPNAEIECARSFVNDGIVATVNDTTSAASVEVIELTNNAGIPRISNSGGIEELSAPNGYPISAGPTGTTFAMVPALARQGSTQMAAIHVDNPQIQALATLFQPMFDSYDSELTEMIPVPAGTTDYQQFVLAAQDSGADGVILPLGEAEARQVLNAAQQLASPLIFSASLGTFGQEDIAALGDFASQVVLNSEVPPATADVEDFPLLADLLIDLEASGEPELSRSQLKASPMRSWLAVYALVTIVEEFGDPDDVSREAITAAFDSATDVDFGGLIAPWTPTGGSGEGLFGNVSNPYFYVVKFDTDAGEFVVEDDVINVIEESEGVTDYPQPN